MDYLAKNMHLLFFAGDFAGAIMKNDERKPEFSGKSLAFSPKLCYDAERKRRAPDACARGCDDKMTSFGGGDSTT